MKPYAMNKSGMNLYDGMRTGYLEIRSHKLRSALTLSGIAIGIVSVITMTGIMSGFQMEMREGIKKAGVGRLFVEAQAVNDNKNQSSGLIYEDALAIRQYFPNVRVVSPTSSLDSTLFFRDFNAEVKVIGVTPEWMKLDWNYILRGRFINNSDMRDYSKVCILVKKRSDQSEFWRQEDALGPLFRRSDPMHKAVRVGNTSFQVVGILEEQERSDMNFGSDEQNILIPISSFQKRLSLESKQLDQIDVDSGKEATAYVISKRIFGLLKRRHRGVEDFRIINIADMMGASLSWANTMTSVMGAVAAIALFAGGVGIMNITLASVNARIKEIGIRKSVGAREKDIMLQFLLEAVTLSVCGGALGVALGFAISYLIKTLAQLGMMPPIASVAVALLVAIGVGIIFSWYPARQASRLDPVEALRYE